METVLLDQVVNTILKTKKTVKKQLSLIESIFNDAFSMDINEKTISDRIVVVKKYKDILNRLLELPQVEQRSAEWYSIRKNLITASDFAQALGKGKFGTANQFYKKKCGYEVDVVDMEMPPLKWGVRYEEVANMFYKLKMNVEVHEFGILKHPTIDFVGASPDGISEMGVMLEIKCPWKRKRTDTIPEQYLYQIQGQLEVCDLEECDYLECYISEYEDRDEMKRDTKRVYKGVIYEFQDSTYKYGQINDLDYSMPSSMRKDIKNQYFYGINEYFLKRVYRDKKLFEELVRDLEVVWNNVKIYREDETEYKNATASKTNKRVKKAPVFMFRKCEDDEITL
jgi:putative phage-type endonuclease